MKDVMIDLETMGTGPTAAIVAIGCVCFDKSGTGAEWYANVSLASSVEHGMVMDPQTVMWWLQQNGMARTALLTDPMPLPSALIYLTDWMPSGARVWGNGATFDNVILRSAYDLCRLKAPWHFRDDRCYRTLKSLWPDVKLTANNDAKHHALYDARWQAQHAVAIMNAG